MTKEELAEKLSERETVIGMNIGEITEAKESGLVIIYGAGIHLLEFAGAIYDEIDAYEGITATVTADGTIVNSMQIGDVDCDEMESCYFFQEWLKLQKTFSITAQWCPEEPKCSWLITATIPGASFDILENGKLYCRGLVIDLNEVREVLK